MIPKVSIIIPVYNSERYLAETIHSALNQTWPNKEIIIVNNGSTDNSLAVAKSFESETLKVFNQNIAGASAARNKGLLEAQGDFIQFLDADDLLSPDKIEEQVKLLQNNPGKIAACSTIHFQDGSPFTSGNPTQFEDDCLINDDDSTHFFINLIGGFNARCGMIGVHAWLTPKSLIDKAGQWNEELTVDDDGEFFCRVILNSTGVIKTNGFSYYRKYKSKQSLSALNSKKALESNFKSILLKKSYLAAYNTSDESKRAFYKLSMSLAVSSYLTHMQLYRLIKKELKNFPDYGYTAILGGKRINYIAKFLGWKFAKVLRLFIMEAGLSPMRILKSFK